jgi:hypothetical protein
MCARRGSLCLLLKSRVKNSAPRPWRCIINPLTRSKRRLARTPPTHRTRRRAARCVCRPFIKYSKQRPAKPHISRRRRCCAAMKCTNYHAARTSSLSAEAWKMCARNLYTYASAHKGCILSVHVRRAEVSACVIIMVRDKISKPLIKTKIHTFTSSMELQRRVWQRRKRPIKNQNLVICKMALPPQQTRSSWLNDQEPLILAQMAACTKFQSVKDADWGWERLIKCLVFRNIPCLHKEMHVDIAFG